MLPFGQSVNLLGAAQPVTSTGIVKSSNGTRSNTQCLGIPNLISESPRHRSARHAFPRLEGLGAKRPLLCCVGVVTTMQEQIAHLIMDRSETLQVTR
jgi:hypothetical protein